MSWRNVNLFQRGWILDAGVRLESKEQRAGAELTLPLDSKGYIWNGVARYERSDIQGWTRRCTVMPSAAAATATTLKCPPG